MPLLVSLMFCGSPVVPTNWLGKVKLLDERSADGLVPVPVSAIVCGLLAALSTREIVAALIPRAAGVKVTLITHVAPAASEAPQVWVKPKSLRFAPPRPILVILSG